MRILWDNKLLDMTITPGTESIDYPSSNIIEPRLTRYFKTENDADQEIVFSAAAAVTASYIAIVSHNISSGATIKLQGNTSDSWTTPAFEETVTWASGTIVHAFTSHSYAYWRLYIDDDNTDGYITIGYVYLGTYLQMPGMEPDQQIEYDTKEGYLFRAGKINFPRVSNTLRASINEMFAAVRTGTVDFSASGQFYADGDVKPIIVLIWANDLDVEDSIYCIIETDKLAWKKTENSAYPWKATLEFREVF